MVLLKKKDTIASSFGTGMYGIVSFCPNSFTTQGKNFFESDYVYQMFTIIVYSRYETNSIPIYVISLYFSTEQIHNLQPKSYLPLLCIFVNYKTSLQCSIYKSLLCRITFPPPRTNHHQSKPPTVCTI